VARQVCAVCCSVLQCITVCCSKEGGDLTWRGRYVHNVALCGSALQCVAVCCSVLQKAG